MQNFKTEVIDNSPLKNSTSRIDTLDLLYPPMRARIEAIISDAAKQGHKLMVLETYRSPARQEMLFRQGATQLEKVGVHGYGLACDLAFLSPDGSVNWKADFSVLGKLAASHGLIWGGDWGEPDKPHSFRDYDHVQYIRVEDQERLFGGEWFPE